MTVEEMIALIRAELQDDIIGSISYEGNVVTVEFTDGTIRRITVE